MKKDDYNIDKVEEAIDANYAISAVFCIKDWDDYQEWVKIVAKHRGAIKAQGRPCLPLEFLKLSGRPND